MRVILIFILFSFNVLSQECLKGILFDKNKNYIREYETLKELDWNLFNLKEGFFLCYPDGMPPIVYQLKENKIEKFYEQMDLKKVQFIPKDCKYLGKIKGAFKITYKKVQKDFPLDQKYNYILSKNSEFLYLKNENYLIEELEGKYYSPIPVSFDFFKEAVLFPSFKTRFIIQDEKGFIFENCKTWINLDAKAYGKSCEKLNKIDFIEGNDFFYTFPQEGIANLKFYCPKALNSSLFLKTKEINNPFIINLKKLGNIRGVLKDKKGNPIKSQSLSLYKGGEIISLKETKTDKEGKFVFSNLEDGKYLIRDVRDNEIDEGKTTTFGLEGVGKVKAGAPDLQIISSDEPKGLYLNELVEIREGGDVFLNLELEEVKLWEGNVFSQDGKPVIGAVISSNYKTISYTDESGKFKAEFRGKKLKNVSIWAEGYSPFHSDEIELENAPREIILKKEGEFKVHILTTKGEDKSIFYKILNLISFLSEGKERKGMLSFIMFPEEIIVQASIPEGEYRFKIEGEPFKTFISDPFFIEAGKEYDYGTIKLELKEKADEDKIKEIMIKIKDYEQKEAPFTNLAIFYKYENSTFSLITTTNEEGITIFKPIKKDFIYFLIYAEGEKGFLKLDMEELSNFNNLDSFELQLLAPNELKVKILNLESKTEKFKIFLRNKYTIIIEEIEKGEEKKFKNLLSPIDLEISTDEGVIWKERIILNPGENELIL